MPQYKLIVLEKTTPPANTDKGNWYYYVISNQANTINGYREGSRKDIEIYTRETIKRLNQKFCAPTGSYQTMVRKAFEPSPYM